MQLFTCDLSFCTFIIDILYCYLWKASQKWNYGTILSTCGIFFYLLEEFNNNNCIAADNFYYSRDLVTHKFARISAQEVRKRTTIEWIYTRDPREHPGITYTCTTYSDLYREGQVCWKNRDVENGSSLFRLQRSHIDRHVTVMRSTPVRWPLALHVGITVVRLSYMTGNWVLFTWTGENVFTIFCFQKMF